MNAAEVGVMTQNPGRKWFGQNIQVDIGIGALELTQKGGREQHIPHSAELDNQDGITGIELKRLGRTHSTPTGLS